MKGKALRKHSLHEKTAASVLFYQVYFVHNMANMCIFTDNFNPSKDKTHCTSDLSFLCKDILDEAFILKCYLSYPRQTLKVLVQCTCFEVYRVCGRPT